MTVRLLVTGDIHIGRRPTKVAEADASLWSCAHMWETIVDRAVAENVDVVALSGDVVDHDNRFFEAIGPLERGLRRLAEHGIHTIAVAGNHDFDVLPRLAEAADIQSFHLLGRGGHWESFDLMRDGRKILSIHGWSFPSMYVRTSPLADYRMQSDSEIPTLGLLHADLDDASSKYAPVSVDALRNTDATLWILGHIHAPRHSPSEATAGILYPGSPQAMDAGETGRHGPWLIEVDGPRSYTGTQLAMSKVRYEQLPIDLTEVRQEDTLDAHIVEHVGRFVTEIAEEDPAAELLSLRLELMGRTPLCGTIDRLVSHVTDDYRPSAGQLTANIEKVINSSAPEIDLQVLSQKHDPPGVLARILLRLQSTGWDQETADLVRAAHEKMRECHNAPSYLPVASVAPPDLDTARALLIQQGTLLLETLRAQGMAR